MKVFDLLGMAFMNLWRRKLRAVLTVLGMVIGTASIVVMISLGIGMQEATRESFESFGSLTTITVSKYRQTETQNSNGDISYSSEKVKVKLDKKAIAKFSKMPGVKAVMPAIRTWGAVRCGKYMTDISILAVDPAEAELFGYNLETGRMPTGNSTNPVQMVLGSYFLDSFYNPNTGQNAVDKNGNSTIDYEKSRFELTFDYNIVYGGNNDMMFEQDGESSYTPGKIYKLEPVGRLAEEGNNDPYFCLVTVEALEKMAKENKDYLSVNLKDFDEVWVKCDDIDHVDSVKNAIKDMGYGTSSLADALEMAQESSNQVQLLLGGIGGVSLFVAAIGIMNTMMMSIYERTREIGIIKVLGCRMSNIALLFLTEAAYIGFFGGMLGLGLSYGLSSLLNGLFMADSGLRSVIPLYLSAFAMLFSVCVALVSGMYPAWRAMRLSALAAIRSE